MDHVHREGVIVFKEKSELFLVLGHVFILVVFSPVGQPTAVDLPSEDHTVGLKDLRVDVLLFWDSVVDADIGASPVAFIQIDCCVDVVLVRLYV